MSAAWSFACPDWEDKLQRGETPIPSLPLDEIEAGVAVDLFNKLRLPDVPGQPTMGEAGGEWFRDIIRAIFGSVVEGPDGIRTRMVGEVFNLVPKKNSKTTNAAGLGLVSLLMNRTPNVQGVVIGPTQAVAETCFAQACGMIAADPYLSRIFKPVEHKQTIIDLRPDEATGRPMNVKLKIKSFDPAILTGGIPAFAIIDELHVMAERHYATRVIGQVRGGMVTNPESLLIFITTQSEIPPSGVFKSELQYARGVRDGRITGSRMLPVLYEFAEAVQVSEDKAWRDTKLWPMVLPNLGRSITLPRLVTDFASAKEKGIEEEARWASQHLNIQIGMGLHTDRWDGADYWKGTADKAISLESIISECEACVIGIDGGGLDDLLGLAVIGRHRASKCWWLWTRAWVHPQALVKRKSIAEKLRDLEQAGDLVICKTPTQDIEEVADICARVNAAGLLPDASAIGLDPEGVAAIIDELDERKLSAAQIVAVTQGYKLTGAIKGMSRKLNAGTLLHSDQPLMDWCVANAKSEARGNAVVVTKAASGTGKIDPLMASFNAFTLMSLNPQGKQGSYLDTEEMVVL